MKRIILTSFSLFFLLTSCGVSKKGAHKENGSWEKLILGKWTYSDVYEKEKLDEEGLKMLNMFFGGMNFNFNDDNTFSASVMNSEDGGTWEVNKNDKKLLINSKKDGNGEMDIISLTASELIIRIEKHAFILKKE